MSTDFFLVGAIVASVMALGLAVYFARHVLAMDRGSDVMVSISNAIREGADAFMRREYTWVAGFVVILAVLIATLLPDGGWKAGAFVFGALLSATAGFVGMRIATAANSRTTEAARTGGTAKALPVAFRGRGRDGVHRCRPGPPRGRPRVLDLQHGLPRCRQPRADLGRRAGCHWSGRLFDRAVRKGRWRHLHEGCRCRRRSGRQGRGRDSGRRSPQPRHDRRQRRRQRRRCGRHGCRPLRELCGLPRSSDRLRSDRLSGKFVPAGNGDLPAGRCRIRHARFDLQLVSRAGQLARTWRPVSIGGRGPLQV